MDVCCKDRFVQSVVPLLGNGAESDLFFTAIGEFESRGGCKWEAIPEHIALVYEGFGTLESPAGRFEIHPDSIFMLWLGERASYQDDPEHPWKYIWFAVDGLRVEEILKQCGLTPDCPVRPAPTGFSAHVRDLAARVDRTRANLLYSSWAAWDCLKLLAESNDLTSSDPAAACKLLIDSSPTDIPSVDALAAQLEIDRSTLFRHFRTAYGVSPKQYIEQRRFKKACALLRETSQSIKEISAGCGFADVCYFSRAFQKRFGVPPGRWRALT